MRNAKPRGPASVAERIGFAEGVVDRAARAVHHLADGRRIHIISRGHMYNLAGPRPLGNSIESMDLGFSLQARCLEAIARGSVSVDACVVPVPQAIDAAVADAYVRAAAL